MDGRKFGRNTSHRKAMFKNMANSVIQKEQIETTVEKAKEARRDVDRLITLAKRGGAGARRLAFDRTRDNEVVKKLFDVLAERYKDRKGGYTRILKKADRRWGDAAEMAILELVDHMEIDRKRKPKAADQKTEGEKGAEGTAPKDPFNRFRKIFAGKSGTGKVGHAGKAAAHSSHTAGAGRKTPSSGAKTGGAS